MQEKFEVIHNILQVHRMEDRKYVPSDGDELDKLSLQIFISVPDIVIILYP